MQVIYFINEALVFGWICVIMMQVKYGREAETGHLLVYLCD